MNGTVKWYNRKKGYGFVHGDDEQDYFVHYSGIEEGNFIRDNDTVSFEPADTDKGKQAQQVVLVQKASEKEDVAPAPAEEAPAEAESEAEEESEAEPEAEEEPEAESEAEPEAEEAPAEAESEAEPEAEEAPAEAESEDDEEKKD